MFKYSLKCITATLNTYNLIHEIMHECIKTYRYVSTYTRIDIYKLIHINQYKIKRHLLI